MIVEYLQRICEMEVNKYFLQKLLEKERVRSDELGKSIHLLKEEREKRWKPMPKESVLRNERILEAVGRFFLFLLYGVIGSGLVWLGLLVVGMILVIPVAIWGSPSGGEDVSEAFFKVWLPIILGSLSVIIAAVVSFGAIDVEGEINEAKRAQEDCAKIDKELERLENEKSCCRKNIAMVKNKLEQVEGTLKNYYDLNILYHKYHCAEAAYKILEYMQSGRCTSLSGPSGAYDTFEREYRMDTVIRQLDEIKNTNQMMYFALQNMNTSINQIYSGMMSQQRLLEDLNVQMGKSIGLLEENAKSTELLARVSENNLQNINDYARYQYFVTKRKRLSDGHWY